ncbi:MAG TPA: hypothetical protein VF155_07095 [Candidatus Dormibacteraeota bacterium]
MQSPRLLIARVAWTTGGVVGAGARRVRGATGAVTSGSRGAVAAVVPLARAAPRTARRSAVGVATAPAMWAIVLYGAGAFLLTGASWHSPATTWPGGCCDPQQTIWFIRWAPYALAHHINPFVTYQLNAPDGVNLMWNTAFVGVGIIVSPVTLLFGPVIAYNVLISAAMALGGWFMYFVVRRHTSGIAGPLVAGAVYAFSPYEAQQTGLHLQVAFTVVLPLMLLVLDSLFIRRRRAPWVLGVMLGALAALQLLIFEEVLLTSALFIVIGLVALGWGRWYTVRRLVMPAVEALGAAVLVFAVLAAWPLWVQFLGPQGVHGALQNTDSFSTDLLNLVLPTQYQRVAPAAATAISTHFSGLDGEATAYIGLPLLIVLVAFVATHWRDVRVRVAAIVAGAALVFSFGPHLHIGGQSTGWPLPWWPLAHLPLVENVLPARLSLYMWTGIAVLIGVAVDIAVRSASWRRSVAALVTIAVSLAAVIPATLGSWPVDTPQFFVNWSQQGIPDSAAVLIAPFFRDGAGASPMLWAATAGGGVRMPEAYAYIPAPDGTPMYGPPANSLSSIMETIQDQGIVVVARGQEREAVAGDLQRLQIQDVIVGPMDNRAQMIAFFTDLLGRRPQNVEGVQIWRNVQQQGVARPPA